MNSQSVPNAVVGFPGRPINGGSNPRFYYFDDDVTRLVKWHPSGHGPKICYNELVASRLAQLVGAPLLRGNVVYVPDEIIPDDHRAVGASPGFHFAVTRMEGDNFIPAQHYGDIENLSQLPSAAVFLAWLAVGDQEGHNQYLQRKEATSMGGRRSVRFMLVDMGFMLGGGGWTTASLAALPNAYGVPSHMVEKLTVDALEPALSHLIGLDENKIRECFADTPPEWAVSSADVAAAADLALLRRSQIRAILEAGNKKFKLS